MKILIAKTFFPFEEDFSSKKMEEFKLVLKEMGHNVDIVRLPISKNTNTILSQLISYRMHHVEKDCDILICEDVFAGLLSHENKICILDNDDIGKFKCNFLKNNGILRDTTYIKEYIHRSLKLALAESQTIFTDSLYSVENIVFAYEVDRDCIVENYKSNGEYESILNYISEGI